MILFKKSDLKKAKTENKQMQKKKRLQNTRNEDYDLMADTIKRVEKWCNTTLKNYLTAIYNQMSKQDRKVPFYIVMFSLLTKIDYKEFLQVFDKYFLPTQQESVSSQFNVDLRIIHKYVNGSDILELYSLLNFDQTMFRNLRSFNGEVFELYCRLQNLVEEKFTSIILELDKDSLVIYQDLRKINSIDPNPNIEQLIEEQEILKDSKIKDSQNFEFPIFSISAAAIVLFSFSYFFLKSQQTK